MLAKEDMEYGKRVFQLGLLDEERIKYCVQALNHLHSQGKKVSLMETMLHFKFLTPEQAKNVWDSIRSTPDHSPAGESFAHEDSLSRTSSPTTSSFSENKKESDQKQFGRYIIEKELGKGGMGKVYQAYDPNLERTIALKTMLTDGAVKESYKKRFLREARSTAKLNHLNIVTVYDIGFHEKAFFFTMDCLKGGSLQGWIKEEKVNLSTLLDIVIKVIRGVGYAHQQGFVHRDLKPANVMMDENGEPKIMDFGLVKLAKESSVLSKSGSVMGTLQYMPPEQAEDSSKVDQRCDIYSLGVILYLIIAKKLPFEAPNQIGLVYQITQEEAIAPHEIEKDIPEALSQICLKAMAKDPKERYQTAEEFADDLENCKNIHYSPEQSLQTTTALTESTLSQTRQGDLSPGEKFGRYAVEAKLGQGGMGAVYKVFDDQLSRSVALKIIISGKEGQNEQDKEVKRFLEEARSVANLKHSNIVEIYEIGKQPQNYFTMEYVEGRPLSVLFHRKSLTFQKAAETIAKCGEAIHHANRKGIIHRDIKPANIMMENNIEPKIMDFGLAKNVERDQKLSRSGDVLGTPVYMSPEQANGQDVDARSDVYSLGATLYEILAKRPPFQGDSLLRLLKQIFSEDPLPLTDLNPDIPKDLEAICFKCLEKKPDKRYQSGRELSKDLHNFIHHRPINARPVSHFLRLRKWIVRNKKLSLTLSLSLLFIFSCGGVFYWKLKEKNDLEDIQIEKTREALGKIEKAKSLVRKEIGETEELLVQGKKLQIEEIRLLDKAEKDAYFSYIILANQFNEDLQLQEVKTNLKECPQKKREWEWYWLKNEKHQEKKTFFPKHRPLDLEMTPDGKRLVSLEHSYLVVYDAQTYKEIWRKHIGGGRHALSIHPNGKIVAVAQNNRVKIWDLEKKEKIEETPPWGQNILDCCFNPDGTFLLTSSEVFDYDKNKPERAKELGKPETYKSLVLWQWKTMKKIVDLSFPMRTYQNNVTACAFSPDNKMVAGVYEDNNIYLWNLTNKNIWQGKEKEERLVLEGHKSKIFGICFSPNSRYLASLGGDKKLIIWETQSGRIVDQIDHTDARSHCSFSPDGKKIVTGDERGILYVRDLVKETSLTLTGHTGPIQKCFFSPDGRFIFSSAMDRTIKTWDFQNIENLRVFPADFSPNLIQLSLNKQELAIASSSDPSIKLLSAIDFQEKQVFPGHKEPAQALHFSSDGNYILSGGKDALVKMWDVSRGNEIWSEKLTFPVLSGTSYIQDEKDWFCLVGEGVVIWDVKTQSKIKEYTRNDLRKIFSSDQSKHFSFSSCSFNSSGETIAMMDEDNKLYFLNWRSSFGKSWEIPSDSLNLTHCLFHPFEAKILLVSEEKLILCDSEKEKYEPLARFMGPQEKITSYSFSSSGKRILASSEQNMFIWDTVVTVEEERPLLVLSQDFPITKCLFSLKGDKIFSFSSENQPKAWVWDASERAKIIRHSSH